MAKSRDAFRTISEVSEWLGTPAHVLRFWESRFSQIKPVKRAGGRRYYRPRDMRLLGGIKRLLHDDGITIKGVQKILREKGVKHVAALCREPLDGAPADTAGPDTAAPDTAQVPEPAAEPIRFEVPPAAEAAPEAAPAPEPRAEAPPPPVAEIDAATRDARILALYQRLQALRDRVRASMEAG